MIRVILMDVGNVLVDFDLGKLLASFLEGSDKSPGQVLAYLVSSGLGERYEKGLITTEEFHATAAQALGCSVDLAGFKTRWNGVFKANKEGVAAFKALKASLPIILASNTNALHFEHLREAYSFLREADGEVLSHEVKARKPEKKFFEKALERAGVRAQEALLIDDLAENIAGAKALGIPGVLFVPGALADGLAEHGLSLTIRKT